MRQSFKLIRNSSISIAGHLLEMGAMFYLVPFALFRLGEDAFSVVVLGLSLQNIVSLLRGGTATATTKYIAANREQHSFGHVNEFMSTAIMNGAFMGILVLVGFGALAFFPSAVAGEQSEEFLTEFSNVAFVVGLGALFSLTTMPFEGFIAAHQRYDITQGFRTFFNLLRVGLIFTAFLMFRPSAMLFMSVTVGVFAATNLSYAAFSRRLMPELRIRPGLLRVWAIRVVFGFGILMLLSQVVSIGYLEGVKWLSLHVFDASTVTDLAILTKIPLQLVLLMFMAMRVLVPLVSEQNANGQSHILQMVIRRGTRAGTMLSVIMAVGLVPVAGPFLSLWLDESYAWIGPHMILLLLAQIIMLPSICSRQSLLGMGKVGVTLAIDITAVVISLIAFGVGLWLDMGFSAITLSLIVNFITQGLAAQAAGIWATRHPAGSFIWQAVLYPMLVGLPVLALCFYATTRYSVDTWPRLVGTSFGSVGLMAGVYLLTLPGEDRELLDSIIKAMRDKISGSNNA